MEQVVTPDRAIGLPQLEEEILSLDGAKILVGDGAQLCYNSWSGTIPGLRIAPEHLRWQTAWGVACEALELAQRGELIPGSELVPIYHRLSQAERERLAKEQTKK